MSQALTVAPRETVVGKHHRAPTGGRLSPYAPVASPKPRTPLSVVPARPDRRRIPFAVFSLLVLAGALAAVLMINISVSSTQYDLVQLRNQQVALSQENEALVLEIEGKEAPQNLAAAATKLKMVSSPTFGTIELGSKKVTGSPEPAIAGPKPEVLIAAPGLGADQPAPVAKPAQTAEPAAASTQSAETADGNITNSEAPVAAGTTADGQVEVEAGPPAGTIPGPVQSGG